MAFPTILSDDVVVNWFGLRFGAEEVEEVDIGHDANTAPGAERENIGRVKVFVQPCR